MYIQSFDETSERCVPTEPHSVTVSCQRNFCKITTKLDENCSYSDPTHADRFYCTLKNQKSL